MRGHRVVVTATAIVVLIGAVCALALTDLHGRAQVRHTDSLLAVADHQVAAARRNLAATRAKTDLVGQEVRAVAGAVLQNQADDETTESSIDATEAGLFFAGYDIGQLNQCLSGVTQALDQVAVGQNRGALTSLGSVASNCNAAR